MITEKFKSNGLPSQQTRYIETMYHLGYCIHGLQWHHHVRVLMVWNPLDQAASVILIQATPGWLWDTWHLIWTPTSASTLGWHQQTLFFHPMALYLAWSSGCRTSECQNCPYPLVCQDTQIWKNLNECWRFSKCLVRYLSMTWWG